MSDDANFYAIYNPELDKFLAFFNPPEYERHLSGKHGWVDDTRYEPLQSFVILPDVKGYPDMIEKVQEIFRDREFNIMEFVKLQFVLVTHTTVIDVYEFHFDDVIPFDDVIRSMNNERTRIEIFNIQSRA